MPRPLLGFAIFFAFALPASAQQLRLEIANGRVTLEATAVPARQILAEWARIGGTKVVGAEKITGSLLTLKLVDVPERQALDVVLRNVAGFMAATRPAAAEPGVSMYDRILILPTAAPVAASNNARPMPGANNPMIGTQRGVRVPPRPPNLPPSSQENTAEEAMTQEPDTSDTGIAQQPVFTFPGPQGQQGTPQNPVFVPVPSSGIPGQAGTATAPVITLQPNANGQPTIYNFVPVPGAAAPPPVMTPFGVVGSPTPGVIQQPPQPAQPTPAGTRPPR